MFFPWLSCLLLVSGVAVEGHVNQPTRAVGGGSCLRAGLCCPGRDSSCVVQEAPVNAIVEDLGDKPCYCDHACLKVGDCCHDFKQACEVVDCEVSAWGPWSACNVDCGSGTMARERNVIRSPRNGGAPCPDQVQSRGCYGNRCDAKSIAKARRENTSQEFSQAELQDGLQPLVLQEMALLLPGKFSQARTVNDSIDIRKNLRLKYPKDPAKELSKEYCVIFEVTKVRKACESITADDVSTLLVKGSRLCISCEEAAMRGHLGYRCNGHGVDNKPTRWTYVANPRCHGRWTRVEVKDRCSSEKPDFIFV